MSAQERRQRRFVKREQELVAIAERVISRHGVHALSIDKLAGEFEFSRSTIYLHFANKADVLCAVAAAVLERQFRACRMLFDEAANARECLLTLLMVHRESVRQHPHSIMVNLMLYDRRMIEEASDRRRDELQGERTRAFTAAADLVERAKRDGHLDPGAETASILLRVWSLMLGSTAVLVDPKGEWRDLIASPEQAVLAGFDHILDGASWAPTSSECDYGVVADRIGASIARRIPNDFWNQSPPQPDL